MQFVKICAFVFALIVAVTSAEGGTQVIKTPGHTLVQTENGQYIRKN
ncbi:immune-induced peptide 14 [Scaptodrosophila lebanonensis]|uniref:Immune-induced peptide 14 n=1 Tax=Drosophila lebanonensis TaxID=7225 RepID=A0A6J2UH07_DROLE|nr:immune-induced peptide 14 [Scaptodrosophila lebanonensis]